MCQLYHCKLPQKFYFLFSKLIKIHDHHTKNRLTKFLTYFKSMYAITKNFSKNLVFIETLNHDAKLMLNSRPG